MYCKGLTKKELIDVGITDVTYDVMRGDWKVTRYWYKGGSKSKTHKDIKITMACGKHKYRPDKYYPKVTFSTPGHMYNIPLSRLIYVWFVGDIPDGMVVDHVDNDSYNNMPTNLQLLTVGENLEKRYKDNPDAWTNQ